MLNMEKNVIQKCVVQSLYIIFVCGTVSPLQATLSWLTLKLSMSFVQRRRQVKKKLRGCQHISAPNLALNQWSSNFFWKAYRKPFRLCRSFDLCPLLKSESSRDHTQTNTCGGFVPINLNLQKWAAGWIWPRATVSTLALDDTKLRRFPT